MSSDIGYLQIKMRELQEQIDELKSKNLESDNKNQNNLEKINDILEDTKASHNLLNKKLKDFEEESIKKNIFNLINAGIINEKKKLLEEIKIIIEKEIEGITKKTNIDLQQIKNDLGNEIVGDSLHITYTLSEFIFTIISKLIDKNIIEKPPVLIFPYKNNYGGKDTIIIFDFGDKELSKKVGFGIAAKWCKEHVIIQSSNLRDRTPKNKIS